MWSWHIYGFTIVYLPSKSAVISVTTGVCVSLCLISDKIRWKGDFSPQMLSGEAESTLFHLAGVKLLIPADFENISSWFYAPEGCNAKNIRVKLTGAKELASSPADDPC